MKNKKRIDSAVYLNPLKIGKTIYKYDLLFIL